MIQHNYKIQLIGTNPKTRENMDVEVIKNIQIVCNLCGVTGCRHLEPMDDEEFKRLVKIAFPTERQKMSDWVRRNCKSALIVYELFAIIITCYSVWDYLI